MLSGGRRRSSFYRFPGNFWTARAFVFFLLWFKHCSFLCQTSWNDILVKNQIFQKHCDLRLRRKTFIQQYSQGLVVVIWRIDVIHVILVIRFGNHFVKPRCGEFSCLRPSDAVAQIKHWIITEPWTRIVTHQVDHWSGDQPRWKGMWHDFHYPVGEVLQWKKR